MQLEVFLIGRTRFIDEAASAATQEVWESDEDAADGELLTEFAARGCYQSWSKPNPATASNADYLAHIEEVGHWSVMEHATMTFYVRGVSRSLTHELIRHRHASYSQLSQRFVVLNSDVMTTTLDDFVVPPLFRDPYDDSISDILLDAWDHAVVAYGRLLEKATKRLEDRGITGTAAKKQAREAARAVLPNMTPTAITLTGNHRAWRELLLKRLQPQADAEIRELALALFHNLNALEPSLYQDLQIIDVDGVPSLHVIPPSVQSLDSGSPLVAFVGDAL